MSKEFKSIFSGLLHDFIDYKRNAGYKYKTEIDTLLRFDDMCSSMGITTPVITKELMDAWCRKKPYESLRSSYQKRLSTVRQFTIYMVALGHEAYIPVNLEHIRQRKSPFSVYIFTHAQMNEIFRQSNRIYPNRRSTMHLVMPVLIRLLYCTGLRVMEAVNLKLKHINLENSTLLIEKAKFNKDRLIPISDSMLDVLKQYCAVMHPLYSVEDYLFIGITRERYSHRNIYFRFRELLDDAKIPHAGRGFGPRIHDIRHTQCCHTLHKAVMEGADLSNMLAALSVYMGHESLNATSQYLRMTAEVYPDILVAVTKVCANAIPEVLS